MLIYHLADYILIFSVFMNCLYFGHQFTLLKAQLGKCTNFNFKLPDSICDHLPGFIFDLCLCKLKPNFVCSDQRVPSDPVSTCRWVSIYTHLLTTSFFPAFIVTHIQWRIVREGELFQFLPPHQMALAFLQHLPLLPLWRMRSLTKSQSLRNSFMKFYSRGQPKPATFIGAERLI